MPPKKTPVTKPAAKPAAKPSTNKSTPAAKKEVKEEKLPVVEINLKRLNVLLDDADKTIANSGRWPLIIDESGASATFLKYRDNFLDATNPLDLHPEKIRLALLGALRYGKGLCLDLGGDDLFSRCEERFSEITPGLMDIIINKDIMKVEHFKKLIKPVDDEQYQLPAMTGYEAKVEEFQMHFATSHATPDTKLANKCYVIKVNNN